MIQSGAQQGNGRRPAYVKAAEDLRDRILSGEFTAASALPSELALAEYYGTSKDTARNAIRRLREWGLVETRRGSGTYVLSAAVSNVAAKKPLDRGLDPKDSRPPSKQIAAHLRLAILSGRLRPGARLPSQHELSAWYGVARETVKSALRQLAAEDLIISRRGSGSFVLSNDSDFEAANSTSASFLDAIDFDSAMSRLDEVHRELACTIQTTPEAQRAFDYSSQLVEKLRELTEETADLRAHAVARIAEHEKLSLTVLAEKISMSRTRAAQLVKRGKKSKRDPKQPRRANGA